MHCLVSIQSGACGRQSTPILSCELPLASVSVYLNDFSVSLLSTRFTSQQNSSSSDGRHCANSAALILHWCIWCSPKYLCQTIWESFLLSAESCLFKNSRCGAQVLLPYLPRTELPWLNRRQCALHLLTGGRLGRTNQLLMLRIRQVLRNVHHLTLTIDGNRGEDQFRIPIQGQVRFDGEGP